MTLDFRKIGQDLIAEAYSHGPPQPEEPVEVCPACHNNNYVRSAIVQRDNDREYQVEPCSTCQRPLEERLKLAGVTKSWRSFNISDPTVDAYAALCELLDGQRWSVTLRGPCGVGKTHLAHGAAEAWIEKGLTAKIINVPDFLSTLRQAIDEEGTNIDERRDAYSGVGLLVLDDFGAERPTQWTSEQMFQVVDRRYRERKPLIVTSNNMRLDQRVMSRLGPGLVEIKANDQRKVYEK